MGAALAGVGVKCVPVPRRFANLVRRGGGERSTVELRQTAKLVLIDACLVVTASVEANQFRNRAVSGSFGSPSCITRATNILARRNAIAET